MKLRNKKTGSLGELKDFINDGFIVKVTDGFGTAGYKYNSITELTKEWEDYEPKEHWYIRYDGGINITCDEADDDMKSIGNDFETKEEAEKAVEKLKAWKRLKDNGLKINRWLHTPDTKLTTGSFIKIEGYIPAVMKNMKDLDLLFGGEK